MILIGRGAPWSRTVNNEYRTVNHCLELLKSCDLPRPVKLRVELQLIQLKRLLINETVSVGDDNWQALLAHMRTLKESAPEEEELVSVMGEIKSLITGLNGAVESPCPGESRGEQGVAI